MIEVELKLIVLHIVGDSKKMNHLLMFFSPIPSIVFELFSFLFSPSPDVSQIQGH